MAAIRKFIKCSFQQRKVFMNLIRTGQIRLFFLLFLAPSFLLGNWDFQISEQVKNHIRERVNEGYNVSIVVGVVDSHGTDFFACGKKSLDSNENVDENTLFEIGSISKVFTAAILADMVIRGELSLDDPIELFMPKHVSIPEKDGKKITLKHLATHTSGFPMVPADFNPPDRSNPFFHYTINKVYNFLSGYTLESEIGEKFRYSDFGFGLLGHVLSLRANMDFEQLLKERVCDELGLKNTFINLSADLNKNLAKGHYDNIEVPNWNFASLEACGALKSTAKDLITFLSANLGLRSSRLQEALNLCHEPRFDVSKGRKIGLGWDITGNDGKVTLGKPGGTGGYRSYAGFSLEKKTGVVVLTNSARSVNDIASHLLDSSNPFLVLRKAILLDEEILEKFVGKYQENPSTEITISKEGRKLFFTPPGKNRKREQIFPESELQFFSKAHNLRLTFQMDESGTVKGCVAHLGQRNINLQKME